MKKLSLLSLTLMLIFSCQKSPLENEALHENTTNLQERVLENGSQKEDLTSSTSYRKSNNIFRINESTKAVFAMNNTIYVIDQNGVVFGYDVNESTVGNEYRLDGPSVGTDGIPSKFIFGLNNKIIVVNDAGEFWAHNIEPQSLGDAYLIPGKSYKNLMNNVKWILPKDNNHIIAVDHGGQVRTNYIGNYIESDRLISGPAALLDNRGINDVIYIDEKIIVLNSRGQLWYHSFTSPTKYVEAKFGLKFNSVSVYETTMSTKYILPMGNKIIFINRNGKVKMMEFTSLDIN